MRTIKEFEYHLWAVEEENGAKRYFARVKETGEETEVSQEVMRVLLRDEKRMRREKLKMMDIGGILSTDQIVEDETSEQWLTDPYDLEEDVTFQLMEESFVETLTEKQKQFYYACMKSHRTRRSYAEEHNIGTTTAQSLQDAIRKKAKKFFN